MDVSDDNDKIRRNLVMASTGALLAAFLNVKVEGTAKLLGVAEVTNLQSWKVWTALMIVLFYLLLRYRFDPATQKLGESFGGEFVPMVQKVVGLYLERKLCWDINRSKTSKILSNDSLIRAIHSLFTDHGSKVLLADWNKRLDFTYMQPHSGNMWKGGHRFNIGVDLGEGRAIAGGGIADVTIPIGIKLIVSMITGLKLFFYTRTGVELLMPYALGGGAVLVCIFKIGRFQV